MSTPASGLASQSMPPDTGNSADHGVSTKVGTMSGRAVGSVRGMQADGVDREEAGKVGNPASQNEMESDGGSPLIKKDGTSYLELILLAIPSMLLSGAAPVAVAVQTALLGRKSTELLAAWAVVSATTNSAVVIFNFMVVGVTAKVSIAVGAKAWREVGARIRLAVTCALIAGTGAGLLLFALQDPIFKLMKGEPGVQRPAKEYYYLRVVGMPSQLLAMAVCGVLQGYKRVYLVGLINIMRLALDIFGSFLALYVFDWGMLGVGLSNVLAATSVAVAGFVCIGLLPPEEGRGKIKVIPSRWRRTWEAWCAKLGSKPAQDCTPSVSAPSNLQAPLLRRVAEARLEEGSSDEEVVEETGDTAGTWSFIFDGLSTIMRSGLIQLTFFLSLVCASRLGVNVTAAHQVVMQLWLVTVYVVDGFANAGTIVGSDLSGRMEQVRYGQEAAALLAALRRMTRRLLYMGFVIGLFVSFVYVTERDYIISLFTKDPETAAELRGVWPLLVIVQVLNATVFIYDGLIYASQSFNYMANCMFAGFLVIFLPLCGLSAYKWKTLMAIWFAKAAFNAVRFVAAASRIHLYWLQPTWRKSWDRIPRAASHCCLPHLKSLHSLDSTYDPDENHHGEAYEQMAHDPRTAPASGVEDPDSN